MFQKQSFGENETQKEIYLDNASTTKPFSEIAFEVNNALETLWYNPSSLYNRGKEVSNIVKNARDYIGYYIGAKGNEIYFTSGGSESNCFAIEGFVKYWKSRGRTPVIITTTIEHKSILECVCDLCADVHFIRVDCHGKIDTLQLKCLISDIKEAQQDSEILVSIQYANNETGVIQDMKFISNIVHNQGAYLHTDAVQSIGNIPVDVEDLGVDMLSASGHKFHGLSGSGFLYVKNGVKISPIIYGTQNNGLRGGTENVVGIIAMEQALRMCDVSPNMIDAKFAMRDKIMNALKELPYDIDFNNYIGYRDTLPTIISMTIRENITAEALVYMLNTANIFVSSGSACNSRSNKPSHVLNAIGLSEEDSIRTIRISFGNDMTNEDIDRLVSEIDKAIKVLKV